MAQTSEDTIGCLIGGGLLIAGLVWLYNNYRIEKIDKPPPITLKAPPYQPPKPTGLRTVSILDSGTVWRIDADSVIGPRKSRQFWIREDHTNDKSRSARETHSLFRVNCDTTGYRTLKVVEYDKDGGVLNQWGEELFKKSEDYSPPASHIGRALKAGCDPAYEAQPAVK